MKTFAISCRALAAGFLVLSAASQGLLAQDSRGSEDLRASSARPDSEEFQKRTYGTADTIIRQIPAPAFQLLFSTGSILDYGNAYVYGGIGTFFASLDLPNGALVNFLDLYFDDEDSGTEPIFNDVQRVPLADFGNEPTGLNPGGHCLV